MVKLSEFFKYIENTLTTYKLVKEICEAEIEEPGTIKARSKQLIEDLEKVEKEFKAMDKEKVKLLVKYEEQKEELIEEIIQLVRSIGFNKTQRKIKCSTDTLARVLKKDSAIKMETLKKIRKRFDKKNTLIKSK